VISRRTLPLREVAFYAVPFVELVMFAFEPERFFISNFDS